MHIAATLRVLNELLLWRGLILQPPSPSLKMHGERPTTGLVTAAFKSISSIETSISGLWVGVSDFVTIIQKYQQHRDKHQGLTAYLVSLGEPRLAQWWRNFEDVRQAGFYGNQIDERAVEEALDLLERVRTWATT